LTQIIVIDFVVAVKNFAAIKVRRFFVVGFAMVLAWSECGAQTTATASAPAPRSESGPVRPRVALVLSGGGARGFAHIGVLRALREMKVPVDIVVGTSMGCVVGGAFAAGQSIEELEKMARTTDWDLVVADRPPRNQLTFRRREEDIALPTRIEFGVDPAWSDVAAIYGG
jgi:NTE family protein